jgi:sugar lactone lactonase YvrE
MKATFYARLCSFGAVACAGAILLMSSSAPAQNLFVDDYYSGNIYEFTPGGVRSTFASGLNNPFHLAFDSAGNLFVADQGSGNIYKFKPGGVRSTFASGLSYPAGLAYDSTGDLFEADGGSGNIYEFTPGGVRSTFASGLNNPVGLAFNSAGNLFVSDYDGTLYEFTSGGVRSTFASGLDNPNGLAFDTASNLFVADQGSGNVFKYTPGGMRSTFASGLSHPNGLAFNSTGNLFEADGGSGNIYEFTPGGTRSTFGSGFTNPNGLAFAESGLQITRDLTNSYVVYGQNATLSISATDLSPISYQWYFNPSNNSGQAGAYAQTFSGFVYGVVVTNGGFGYGVAPSVSFIGGGATVNALGYVTVSNGAVAGITVTNGGYGYTSLPAVVIGPPNGFLYGQTNSTLVISNASVNSLGNYFVVVSDTNGNSVTSSVVSLTLLYPPSITNDPVGFSANLGASGSLGVLAGGTLPLSYQWFLDGTNITDATNSTYEIASLALTNAGGYTVEVSNPYGSVSSSPANVFVLPSLVSPFTGAIGIWGQNVGLSVGAVGSGMLDYQWYFDGQAISGANSSSYDLDSIQFTNAGLYSVVVSSAYGSVTNAAYQVIVNPSNVSLALRPDVIIQGTVGYSYIIQSTTNLGSSGSWITETNITLTAPTYEWIDYNVDTSKSATPQKFYQVLPGQ